MSEDCRVEGREVKLEKRLLLKRVGIKRNENYVRRDLDKIVDRKVGSCHLLNLFLLLRKYQRR